MIISDLQPSVIRHTPSEPRLTEALCRFLVLLLQNNPRCDGKYGTERIQHWKNKQDKCKAGVSVADEPCLAFH